MLLLFFFLILLGAFLLERASLKDDLSYISYACRPDKRQTEPGRPFVIIASLTNRRRLPVAFLRLEEQLPPSLAIEGEAPELRREPGSLLLCSTAFLMPREILHRKITASLPRRGRYIFRGALIYAGDFLGLQERGRSFQQTEEIVVYPAPAESPALGGIIGDFWGAQSVRRFLFEDPILTLGFREYTGREPQRAISWPQSLAKGRLTVKQYDFTQDLSAAVLLNTDCGAGDPTLIEEAFSLARSICEALEKKKIRYSFLTNAATAGAMGQWRFLPAGLGSAHFYTIMEGLGRATYDHTESCAGLLKRAEKRGEQAQAHLLITPRQDPRLAALGKRLEAVSGGRLYVFSAADSLRSAAADSTRGTVADSSRGSEAGAHRSAAGSPRDSVAGVHRSAAGSPRSSEAGSPRDSLAWETEASENAAANKGAML
jgi:uncharacterized protein (DUF58 family)